jgi:hypothetical protein
MRAPIVMRQFIDAVLALSEEPDAGAVERYLAASQALEDFMRGRRHAVDESGSADRDGHARDPRRLLSDRGLSIR